MKKYLMAPVVASLLLFSCKKNDPVQPQAATLTDDAQLATAKGFPVKDIDPQLPINPAGSYWYCQRSLPGILPIPTRCL